jgi:N-acetylneuraminic acid mutarotase
MKRWIQTGSLLMLFIIVFQACEEWDLAEEDFISVEFSNLEVLSLNSLKLTGEIKDLKIGQVSDHGFLWTSKQTTPTFYENEGISSLGIKDKEDDLSFSVEVENFAPDTQFKFVAFAMLDGAVFYSEIMTWSTDGGLAFTDSLVYNGGSSLQIFGRVSATDAGFVIVQHGFCWSTDNEIPNLEDEFIDLGNQYSDLPFSSKVSGLEDEVILYLRAYAVLRHPTTFALTTVYGNVISFNGNLADAWTQKADFSGGYRYEAVGFSINDKGYVGTGYGRDIIGNFSRAKDFWEYDPQTDVWAQRMDFGGVERNRAVGFSINGKGYVGTGYGNDNKTLKDFWEYDPQTDVWTKKADFGGGERDFSVGFSINDKGYVGTGIGGGSAHGDFWEYDTQTNAWTRKADFGGQWLISAVGFSINDKGYMGLGGYNDFWEYDPQIDAWTQKADFAGDSRSKPVGFSIKNKGYIGTNISEGSPFNDFWEYDPQTNIWVPIADLVGSERESGVGFSINDKGYVGTGRITGDLINDFWEYAPR